MFEYKEVLPAKELRDYVKCYFIFRLDPRFDFSDIKYPNGQVEVGFNLGESSCQSEFNNKNQFHPKVELLGQFTQPILLKSPGKALMLGIRFYSYTAGYFFDHPIEEFNNQVLDLRDVQGGRIKQLYEQLLNERDMDSRIATIEKFLLKRLAEVGENTRLTLLKRIACDLHNSPESNIKHIAGQYNISPRNMQRLFLRHMGITPKLYERINRFQQCLQYIGQNEDSPLTGVAYKFGYADQSHFIKDFKIFSNTTPSNYSLPALLSK